MEDDERLDAILATLRRKAPAPPARPPQQPPQHKGQPRPQGPPAAAAAAPSSQPQGPDTAAVQDTSSVKGELAQGLAELRGRIKGLEDRLHAKQRPRPAPGR